MTIRRPRDELLRIEEILRQLRDGPPQIRAMTAGLLAADLRTRPTPDEWSINDNLAHLRASADVWGNYVGRIVAEDNPSFTSINPRAHMRKTDYPELEFAPSFRAFADQRDALLAILESLTAEGWARTAVVKVYGDRFACSVQYYSSKLARHEAVHIPQIEGVVIALRP
jgi:DinB superfamily